MNDINITFIAPQPADECGWCDCIAAGLLDREDVDEHGACYCGGLAHRRVIIHHGERTERLPVCGRCITQLMQAITQAVTPGPVTATLEAEFVAIVRGMYAEDSGDSSDF